MSILRDIVTVSSLFLFTVCICSNLSCTRRCHLVYQCIVLVTGYCKLTPVPARVVYKCDEDQ